MGKPTRPHQSLFASAFHAEVTAWVVLAVSLVLTALGWYISHTHVERRAEERFAYEVDDARQRIVARMRDYEQVLRSGVSLFKTLGRQPTRDEWHAFVSGLDIQAHFPGIQGVGYAVMLAPQQLAGHEASLRAEGFADYAVSPPGERDTYSAIVYLEPFDWRNQRAFGYDMYSNPMRRAAMDHARDTGRPAVSGRVTLVQETEQDVQAGFLVYLPVYAPGLPVDTVAQRRAALSGYVYSPFRMADLMRGILGGDRPEVDFVLHDEPGAPSADTLLYASADPARGRQGARQRTVSIDLPGRQWRATFHETDAFAAAVASRQPALIAIGGGVVDLLLFLVLWSMSTERRRVAARVAAITADVREAKKRLRLAQESAQIGTWELALPSGRLIWDARMHELYDTPPELFSGDVSAWQRCVHPDDRAGAQAAVQQAIAAGTKFNAEFRIVDRQGKVRVIEAHANVHTDADGQPRRMIGVNLDVTERREAEAKLSLAASVFDHAHEGIVITDADQCILDVNPAFTTLTGYPREEVLGRKPTLLKSGRHDAAFYQEMWQQLATQGFWRGEIWNRRKSGELFALRETISAVRDGQGSTVRYIAVFSDITRLVEQQARLERMAHFDALTGLPNRALLADRLQQAMAQARRSGKLLAVCYLDMDGFKPVNDRFGHAAGDALLVDVADRLRALLRESDSAARLGGDEFVVLLNGIEDVRACESALKRLTEGLKDLHTVGGGERVELSASIGVTLYPHDDVDADALLRHADHAMYFAKERGRGCYQLFDAEQHRQVQAHRQEVARVEAALANGEFVLHYQPKVDMRTGREAGAEALIRWQHPERGLLLPAAFLSLLDCDALAAPVGFWVIDTVLRQQAAWRREGLSVKVSINVSGRHLRQPGFAARLDALLRQFPEVPPSLVELEVLESVALHDISTVSAIIAECRALGVSVSLDDFGAGYASLASLQQLPVDTLKIDVSVVRDMLGDAGDLSLVEGILGLGDAFRRRVIAEGVESEAHGELLLRLGCDLGQGFGIARPMPAEQLPSWIRQYRQPQAWRQVADTPWLRDDLPLYAAGLHHRRCIDQGLARGAPEADPAGGRDPLGQRFAEWYTGEGRSRYGHLSEFAAIGPAHRELHRLAREAAQMATPEPADGRDPAWTRMLQARQGFLDRLLALQTVLGHPAGADEQAASDRDTAQVP